MKRILTAFTALLDDVDGLSRAAARSLRRLTADREGAIMTMGVFIAPFLVGAIYYMVSCANVLMQREGLQQAADAAVFSPSVLSARGMNAIAVMNVLMMCIMSIMIPIRALLPAYAEAGAIYSMMCSPWNPCACAAAADAKRARAQLKAKATRAEQRAKQLLEALSNAQDALSQQVPQAGKQAANASAKRTNAFLQGDNPDVYSSSLSPQGCRKGLPVEDDDFKNVCRRTKPYVWEIAVRIAGPTTLDTLGPCQSGGLALALASGDLNNPTNSRVCKEKANPPCSGSGPHPKKVVQGGKNGTDHMAWWVKLKGKEFDRGRTGVEVASNNKKGKEYDKELDIGFAQSEIYFDCNGAWTASACNGSSSDENAMWDTKWTSRLRRVHKPENSFSGDSEVRTKLADPQHWKGLRDPLVNDRKDFTTGNTAATDVANLIKSSAEGPLQ